MDAPAMVTRKHVPEDVGLRNAGEYPAGDRADRRCSGSACHHAFRVATWRVLSLTLLGDAARAGEDGGQGQLHREEKQHKPVLKKVKEKVKKIKHTLAGHGHGGEHGGDERGAGDAAAGSTSSEEAEEDAAEREAALEKGGYMEDVEDKPVVAESDPEVHGAPSKCYATCSRSRRG